MAGDIGNAELLAALNQLIKATNDQVLTPAVTIQPCGCETGTDDPSEPFDGGSPPPGWETPPPTVDRKCKAAEIVHDDFRYITDQLDTVSFESVLFLGAGTLTSMILAIVAALGVSPIGIALAAIGAIGALIIVFIAQTIDLTALVTILDTHKTALVCELYNADDAITALGQYRYKLGVEGATTAQLLYFDAVVTAAAANAIFLKFSGDDGDALETRIDNFTSTVDCDLCDVPCSDWLFLGTFLGGISYSSELFSTEYFVDLLCNNVESAPAVCGPLVTFTVSALSGFTPHPTWAYRLATIRAPGAACVGWDRWCSPVQPTWPQAGCRRIKLYSTTAFTVDITRIDE